MSWLNILGFGKCTPTDASMNQTSIAQGPDDGLPAPGQQFAWFSAGCFWGVELAFQRVPKSVIPKGLCITLLKMIYVLVLRTIRRSLRFNMTPKPVVSTVCSIASRRGRRQFTVVCVAESNEAKDDNGTRSED
ncbi:hypothetical protein L6452_20372 [Arctium lappa]|uniref:Uncharacterized protein n=1 Tax=Arctium lappa TaxID=4217 RepID=A0ACB9BBM3_ARCLA|nr:hypothetical protein L6452_20372 [Arctium lappa]